jgi:hypothetical protein
VNKDRFNQLLGNLHEVTNEDIKSLNELRKKYPFFQTPYVIIAKALKKIDHPKTGAFIKKAAIYSPDRAHLKKIITGEIDFDAPEIATVITAKPIVTSPIPEEPIVEAKPQTVVTVSIETAIEPEAKKHKAPPLIEKVATEIKKEQPNKSVTAGSSSVNPVDKEAEKGEDIQLTADMPLLRKSVKTDQITELERDLIEIRERKLKLAKFLNQQEEKAEAKKLSTKKLNISQIELIEKFIKNEPHFENKKGFQLDSEYEQEDLSSKKMKNQDEFTTETLANLFFQQKKYKKAINIYEKLSLKFPEKRTYFAGRIQKIKEVQHV